MELEELPPFLGLLSSPSPSPSLMFSPPALFPAWVCSLFVAAVAQCSYSPILLTLSEFIILLSPRAHTSGPKMSYRLLLYSSKLHYPTRGSLYHARSCLSESTVKPPAKVCSVTVALYLATPLESKLIPRF